MRRRGLARAAGLAALAAAVLLVGGELAVRLSGMADFPLYRADRAIGYIPRANQHGSFLHSHRWVFNDRSMGVAAPFRPTPDGVLLLGDSVVMGGDPLNQPDKLGPRLQDALGRPVWPIAAGSWALQNELEELRLQPDFARLGAIVVVSNSEDFGAPSVWRSQLDHPTHRPLSALAFAATKYLFHPEEPRDAPWTPADEAVWRASLQRFLAGYHGRVLWVLHPLRGEVGRPIPAFDPLRRVLAGRVQVLDMAADRGWSQGDYRDRIHPNAQGDRLLAAAIAHALAAPPETPR